MSRRYRYRRSYGHSYGYEAARRHLSAAKQLSQDLGGADRLVKEYFFSLSPRQLSVVLDDYERTYGRAARSYAEQAIPKWKSGKVQMGGQTAERLFQVLPRRMPLPEKYKLTEYLWNHFGPSSKKRLRIGLDADLNSVVQAVHTHMEEVVTEYKIPPDLEHRFNWLSSGDVSVKQELLNYIRKTQKALAVEATRVQVPVMFDHLSSSQGQNTQRIAQILKIGKHELELLPDRKSTGVKLEDPWFNPYRGKSDGWGWIWPWLIFIGLIWWFASRH